MAANCNDSLTTFNKQAVWEEQCVPALRRLVSLCSIYDIPLFVTACIRNDRSGISRSILPSCAAMTCTCPISSAACRRWRTWTRYFSTEQ